MYGGKILFVLKAYGGKIDCIVTVVVETEIEVSVKAGVSVIVCEVGFDTQHLVLKCLPLFSVCIL